MGKSFNVDLRVKNGCTLLMVFDAMKRLQQESSLIDKSVTISYDDRIKITAGLYNTFDEFDDLFMSVVFCDKELIKRHVSEILSKCDDSELVESAINNICDSMEHMKHGYRCDEKEELLKLAGIKEGYTKRKTRNRK